MELHLLRHADAGDPGQWKGPDALRPLSPKGQRQAERLARHLERIGYGLDVVVTSPKVRARETADQLASALALRVVVDERLANPLGLSELQAILEAADNVARPVLVGHDPDFSSLLSLLTGVQGTMAKGAFARIAFEPPVSPGAGTLDFLLPPRLLPR
jgi:phosphohistidine phosphatase